MFPHAYNDFRNYDPTLGRYVQSDPIGLAAGTDTYSYVRSNPVGKIDPTDLFDFYSTCPTCNIPKMVQQLNQSCDNAGSIITDPILTACIKNMVTVKVSTAFESMTNGVFVLFGDRMERTTSRSLIITRNSNGKIT